LKGEDWAGGPNVFLVAASVSRRILTHSASKGSTQVKVTNIQGPKYDDDDDYADKMITLDFDKLIDKIF
jgi:hypothetical protein